jgi:hypothetical protein
MLLGAGIEIKVITTRGNQRVAGIYRHPARQLANDRLPSLADGSLESALFRLRG